MPKPLKILYIEPCPLNFGGYYRSFEICQALSRQNIKVDLLVSSNSKIFFKITKNIINQNLTIYVLPRLYLNFYITGRFLRGIIGTFFGIFGKYDIIHASSIVQLESNIPLSILKLFGKKTVMSWDDIWTDKTSPFNIHILKYLKFWENNAPKFFNNVCCISQILVNKAKKFGAKNVIKIINGTDPNYFCPAKSHSQKKLKLNPKFKYLLIFGNSFGSQRAQLILKVFNKILLLNPKTKLITNFNPKDFSLSDNNVVNVGYIPEKLLPYYLAASDAVLFIMGNNLNEKACYPVRIGKFLSSESIIIINDNNSETTTVLKKYQCAIIDQDLNTLAQKTVDYFSNTKLQTKLHSSTIKAKKELSWDNLVSPLITLYQDINSR